MKNAELSSSSFLRNRLPSPPGGLRIWDVTSLQRRCFSLGFARSVEALLLPTGRKEELGDLMYVAFSRGMVSVDVFGLGLIIYGEIGEVCGGVGC